MTLLDDSREVTYADEPAGSALSGRTPRELWRTARAPVLIAAFALVVTVVMVVFSNTPRGGLLDPDSPQPAGGMALAVLLRERGVDVERRPVATQRGVERTIFLPVPDLLPEDRLREAGESPFDLVVVAPDHEQLAALGIDELDARPLGLFEPRGTDPDCELPAARTAGRAELGGVGYDTGTADEVCYSRDGVPTLLGYDVGPRRFVIVGTPDVFTNDRLDEEGNAALALGLLSRHGRVEWLRPRLDELIGTDPNATDDASDLLPRRVDVTTDQLLVFFVFLVLWRARRLGPVVTEPLPVVVRAAETVEGRGRLYQAAHARDRAAWALRVAAHDRLVRLLGLGADASPDPVATAVAERTGAATLAVHRLLYGPPPADDAGLVRLAADLDTLDSEVRRP